MLRESRIVYPGKTVKPPRAFPRRPVFILLVALGIFGLGIGIWYVAGLPALAVNQIEVSGTTEAVPIEGIRQAAVEIISGKLWLLLPRNNFFAVSGKRIERKLRQRFPEISAVDVKKNFPHRLLVHASGRQLWGVYCERPSAPPAGGCAYLDADGLAYEELSSFSGWLLPVMYGPSAVRLGAAVVPSGRLQFFDRSKEALALLGGNLLWLSSASSTPEDVRLGLAEGWQLWVTAARPVEEWAGILKTLLEKDIGVERSRLEYIDLRFGNKVFYKFRN